MSKEVSVNHLERLDIARFTKAAEQLQGQHTAADYPRLAQELQGDPANSTIAWQVQGEFVPQTGGAGENWLHLDVQAQLPLTCQRCLQPVDVSMHLQRAFRFVKDEATAEALDDECEEDLLAMSRAFDLHSLIEDELLMDMPLVPRHTTCPAPLAFSQEEQAPAGEVSDKPHPFAALAGLRAQPPKTPESPEEQADSAD